MGADACEIEELIEEGLKAFRAGDAERSDALNREALTLARERGDTAGEAQALAGLMRLALRARDFAALEELAEEGARVAEAASDRSLLRMPLHMRAEAARMQGDFARARDLYDASIALNRELGNERMVTVELGNKAWAEIADGRLGDAEELALQSFERLDDDDAYGRAFCLLALARIELERDEPAGALKLKQAEALLEGEKLVWDPAEEPEYVRTVELANALVPGGYSPSASSTRVREP